MKMKTISFKDNEQIHIVENDKSVLILEEAQANLLVAELQGTADELDKYLDEYSKSGDDDLWVRLGQVRSLISELRRQLSS